MASRALTAEERSMTLKGIGLKKKQTADLKKALKAQEAEWEYILAGQKYEDATREFIREQKKISYENIFEEAKEKIKANEYSINEMEKQVKFGVEIKANKAVEG